jgi:methyl-accepting chemotaxis protein
LVKRVRGATNTTNEFVSAWKQFFDNIARGIVNFFKSIGNLIAKVVNFFKGLPPEIRLAINVLMLFIHPITQIIGAFNIATDVMDKFGISLQRPVSKAASQMRVLNNQVKDLNKEIRESRQEVGKLEKALDEYDRLNKIIFKTKQETEDLNQVVERLQELLETDLTGVGLAILARGELARQTKEIEDKLNQVDVLVQNYFRRNEGLS